MLGPPSHIGGRHPGPLYYWFVTFVYALSGQDLYISNIIFVICKFVGLFFLFLTLNIITNNSKNKKLILIALLIVLLSPLYIKVFRMHWQSNFLFIASSFAFLVTVLFIKYKWQVLGLYIFGLSCLFQSHLSSVPVLAGLGSLGLLVLFFRKNYQILDSKNKVLFFQVLPLVFTTIIWSPVIYNELFLTSNFKMVFQLHSDPYITKAGPFLAFSYLIEFFSGFILASKASLVRQELYAVVFYIVSFISLIFIFLKKQERVWHILLFLLPMFFCVLAVSSFRIPIYVHYFNSLIALPVLIFAFIIWNLLVSLEDKNLNSKIKIFPFIILVFFFIIFANNLKKTFTAKTFDIDQEFYTLAHSKELSEIINKDAAGSKVKLYTRLGSKYMTNSYYYFLNQNSHRFMEYNKFFRELSAFKKVKRSEREKDLKIYSIICPRPYERDRKNILRNIKKYNKEEYQLDLSECKTCSSCTVSRLVKD